MESLSGAAMPTENDKLDNTAIPVGNGTECLGCAASEESRRRRGTERKAQPKTIQKIVYHWGNRFKRRVPRYLTLCFVCLALLASIGGVVGVGCVNASTGSRPAPEFDGDWSNVPKAFKGDDFVALSRALSVEQGEFEPLAAYTKKIRGLAEQKEKYVFLLDAGTGKLPNFGVRYNPSKEVFEIKVTVGWDSTMLLAQDENSRYAFGSMNAFGTSTRVVDMAVDKYSVRLLNESLNIVTPTDRTLFEGTLKSPLAEAPGLKGRIRFLLVAKVVPGPAGSAKAYAKSLEGNPYYSREFFLTDATTANPVNLNEYTHFLNTRLEAVWVYDEQTGAVLRKVTFAENDGAIAQARQALAEGKYYTAEALVSKLPADSPVVKKIKDEISAMRLENADDENRRRAEDMKNERLRVHGPEPDPVVTKRFIQRLVPTLIEGPTEIVAAAPPVRALSTINGELRAVWQVRVEVRSKRDQTMSHLYVYLKYDEIVGYDLI